MRDIKVICEILVLVFLCINSIRLVFSSVMIVSFTVGNQCWVYCCIVYYLYSYPIL
jgi:hypothetical protein